MGYHGIYLKRKTCNNDNFCHGQLQTHLFTSGDKIKYKYGGGFYLQRANINCKSPADEAFRDVLVVSCQNLSFRGVGSIQTKSPNFTYKNKMYINVNCWCSQDDKKQKNDTSLSQASSTLEPIGKIQMKTRRQLRGEVLLYFTTTPNNNNVNVPH